MKVLTTSLTALSALTILAAAGGQAQAQDHDRGDHHGGPGGGFRGPPGGGFRPQGAPTQPQQSPQQPRPQFQGGGQFQGGQFRGRGGFPGGQQQAQPQASAPQAAQPQGQAWQGRGWQGQGYRGGQPQGGQGQAWQGRGWQGQSNYQTQGRTWQGQGFSGQYRGQPQYRGGDPRRGWNGGGRQFSYRGGYHSAFRAAPYRFPGGYGYHRYGIHERFPRYLLLEPYFLYDYGSYFLSPPPGPEYRWVRYGPDAVLVDTYTGDIVDVAYGVFYDGDDDGYGYDD